MNDEVLKEQHSAGLYKRRDAAIKLFTSYELKLIGLFQDGWSQLEVLIKPASLYMLVIFHSLNFKNSNKL